MIVPASARLDVLPSARLFYNIEADLNPIGRNNILQTADRAGVINRQDKTEFTNSSLGRFVLFDPEADQKGLYFKESLPTDGLEAYLQNFNESVDNRRMRFSGVKIIPLEKPTDADNRLSNRWLNAFVLGIDLFDGKIGELNETVRQVLADENAKLKNRPGNSVQLENISSYSSHAFVPLARIITTRSTEALSGSVSQLNAAIKASRTVLFEEFSLTTELKNEPKKRRQPGARRPAEPRPKNVAPFYN